MFSKIQFNRAQFVDQVYTSTQDVEPTVYLNESITAMSNYLVKDVRDRDLVGLRIRNTENVQDKVLGLVSDVVTT